jgi:hypothetical protein
MTARDQRENNSSDANGGCTVVCDIAEVEAGFSMPGAWPGDNLAQ